jgi:hypothetical protein
MPKNTNPSQLDNHQISKLSFEENHDAVRVVNVLDQKHEIEISAESGDSIQSVARAKCITSTDNAVDCSSMRTACGYNGAAICLSPDGTYWTQSMSLTEGVVTELCSMQIKVLSGSVVMRS